MNPFSNMFGMGGNNPINNMAQLIGQFNQFRNGYQGTPQMAQQQVQQMLNSGQVSQSQFNQMTNLANQILSAMGKR